MPLLFLPLKREASTHFSLLNSGASNSFISTEVVQKAALRLLPLKTQVKVRVANGEIITVSHFVRVNASVGTLRTRFFLRVIPTPLPIILGCPFFQFFNPEINWKEKTLRITMGTKTHDVPVVQVKGMPLQPLMNNSVETEQMPYLEGATPVKATEPDQLKQANNIFYVKKLSEEAKVPKKSSE